MSPFYIGLAAGLLIGAFMGFFFIGLLMIAREAYDKANKVDHPAESSRRQPTLRVITGG